MSLLRENVALVSFAEIALKSEPVRRSLLRLLSSQIGFILRRHGIKGARIRVKGGRAIVEGIEDTDLAARTLSKVFGVVASMPAIKTSTKLEDILQTASGHASLVLSSGESFAVRARRIGEHSFSSKEIEIQAGSEILRRNAGKGVKVNLDNPDKTIHVEVREENAYVYSERFQGPAGFPLGSQGRLVSLFSGGIDSPVATWLMMKRGAMVVPLFLDMQPYAGEDYREKAVEVARKLGEYVPMGGYYLMVAPFGEVTGNLVEKCPKKYTCLLCKRMMYRVACAIAEEEGAEGLVTGESLGQVASQTLVNLRVISESSKFPIFRPLIGFDKMETQKLAQKIGTYDASIRKARGCSVFPSKPSTRAKLEIIREIEKGLQIDRIVTTSVEAVEKISI